MSTEDVTSARGDVSTIPSRAKLDLFLISVLILFLELACIRWFPAHVLFLTFFTNTVLLACFLGMSLGCLACGQSRNYLRWTPWLLLLALTAGLSVEFLRGWLEQHISVGNQASPQFVYFGTEYNTSELSETRIPIEAVAGFFFLIITLTLVGPGQELGRALTRVPDRVQAYTINIAGSIVGIVLFAGCSYLQLPPLAWFLPVAVGILYFLGWLGTERFRVAWLAVPALVLSLFVASRTSGTTPALAPRAGGEPPGLTERLLNTLGLRATGTAEITEHYWSPYYRIDYEPAYRYIQTNLIGHQAMRSRNDTSSPAFAYSLPHLLDRDSRALAAQPPRSLDNVLIIGAGSGNDVSRALQWGAKHIDAVEIDPVIYQIGKRDNPDKVYQVDSLDPRVTVHLGDGRNFLRSTDKKYDLIIYALVDSLVLHSGYSNIRLESYLFTRQAFADVRARLKPDGVFVMYNYFRQGWIVARLYAGLEEAFGADNPLFLCLPSYESVRTIEPETVLHGYFTAFFAGDTSRLKDAFAKHPAYRLSSAVPPNLETANGFTVNPDTLAKPEAFYRSEIVKPKELKIATDDWPFLYLRAPMIPTLSLWGAFVMALMGVLAGGLLFVVMPWFDRTEDDSERRGLAPPSGLFFDFPMFFLGAGFMLIETRAVVHMALLFGSTWMVNSIVFFAILVMILGANLFVLKVKPENLTPYYAGLFVTLLLNVLVPLDSFLGMPWMAQVVASCALVFAPILFAGVIFSVKFRQSERPDQSFGANIAGALAGGLAEYSSMLLGFQYLGLVAMAFYGLSALRLASGGHKPPVEEKATEALQPEG
jgi:hypothetical protein